MNNRDTLHIFIAGLLPFAATLAACLLTACEVNAPATPPVFSRPATPASCSAANASYRRYLARQLSFLRAKPQLRSPIAQSNEGWRIPVTIQLLPR
jgi:hypothetical protein